ncbi:protein-L-isoaspartate(D-aspartate) O-methyltransferase [Alphaproteobacteria bacterium]|nr:protein-L-isoaspartate(D-aspartate) O-methyltransferase [Alphaproteobacteria bacterium]
MPWARRKLSMLMAVRGAGVTDLNTLNAIEAADRSIFVPSHLSERAYEVTTLPIGFGQTLSSPDVVGLMTQALGLKKSDRVLEIGTGSGYQTLILSKLCREVFTIERHEPLSKIAQGRLDKIGINNVHYTFGDGFEGLPDQAPFDAILITAAPDKVPSKLATQMAEDSRLVLPIGPQGQAQRLIRVTRKDGRFYESDLGPVRFVPMLSGVAQESMDSN